MSEGPPASAERSPHSAAERNDPASRNRFDATVPVNDEAGTTGTTDAGAPNLLLLAWLSPAFPVGAFAYSHGLEWAVEAGDIRDASTLQSWVGDLIAFGALANEVILCASAWRAALRADHAALAEVNALALALSPSRERHLETISQGVAFRSTVQAVWPHPVIAAFASLNDDIAYPVAVGLAAGAHGLGLGAALDAFALSFVSNLVSAAVRLGPIGQTDGQRVIAALIPGLRRCAASALDATLDDLGSACGRSDIASMAHETQYSRLFRS